MEQLVARRPHKPKVLGSSPSPATVVKHREDLDLDLEPPEVDQGLRRKRAQDFIAECREQLVKKEAK